MGRNRAQVLAALPDVRLVAARDPDLTGGTAVPSLPVLRTRTSCSAWTWTSAGQLRRRRVLGSPDRTGRSGLPGPGGDADDQLTDGDIARHQSRGADHDGRPDPPAL